MRHLLSLERLAPTGPALRSLCRTATLLLLPLALLTACAEEAPGSDPLAEDTGTAAPAPDTTADATNDDTKTDAVNDDAGVDAADVLALDANDGTRSQGTLTLTDFAFCNTNVDCPNGMGLCVTELELNRKPLGATSNMVAVRDLPGFESIPVGKAGVCSRGCSI